MDFSFVIPCYKSQNTIEKVVQEINSVMKGEDFEIILINDNSPDQTWQKICEITKKNANVTGLNMAKNFGQHAALMAGYRQAKGEVIVSLDDDGQTPANEVWKLINKISEGYDVVYASYAEKKHSGFRNWGSKINSKMTEMLLDKPKEIQVTSYFAMKRFILEEVIKYDNAYPYVIGLVLRCTNNITNVPVIHRERQEGVSGYSLKKLIALWMNGFTAFSVKPLRVATLFGICMAFFGFVMTMYTVIHKIINPDVLMGWSSLFAAIFLVGGCILFMLGLIGEYIGRIYISLNNAPQYIVKESVTNNEE